MEKWIAFEKVLEHGKKAIYYIKHHVMYITVSLILENADIQPHCEI